MAQQVTFATLPTEIQMLILNYAIAEYSSKPRIHSIVSSKRVPSKFISDQPNPPLLHVCSLFRNSYLSSVQPTFAYGTYINLAIDTLYFVDCPTPVCDLRDSDGFEVVKELGRDISLKGKVKRIAVGQDFWLRPTTVTRSIAVDAWNATIQHKLGGGLQELCIVFPTSQATSMISSRVDEDGRGTTNTKMAKAQRNGLKTKFQTIGWFQVQRDEVGERAEIDPRAKRCDTFLRTYMGYFSGTDRWNTPTIKYVVIDESCLQGS